MSGVSTINSSYKIGGTKDFHAQMAVTIGEQFKGKMENKHCEMNYYVTKLLTDHGCCRKFLHRFGYDIGEYVETVWVILTQEDVVKSALDLDVRSNDFRAKPAYGRGVEF